MKPIFPRDIFGPVKLMETPRLILRKITPDDSEDMFEYASLESVTEYLTWYPHPTLQYTRRYVRSLSKCYSNGTFFDWGLELKSEHKFIGTCGYTSYDLQNNSVEVGYVLSPSYQHRGLMTEALGAVLVHAFGTVGAERVEARHIVGNNLSAAVMKRCRMKYEGTARHFLYIKDKYRDISVYSILKDEYFNPPVC